MNKDEALTEVKQYLANYLLDEKGIDVSKTKGNIRCFFHEDKKASMSYLGTRLYCHSCREAYDILDLIADDRNMDVNKDFYEVLGIACDMYGIELDNHKPNTYHKKDRAAVKPAPAMPVKKELTAEEIASMQEKNRRLIALGMAHLTETNYLADRGIDLNTARAFKLGYVPNYRGMGEAVIIPTNLETGNHLARLFHPLNDNKYMVAKGEHRELFNLPILYVATAPIIITEGELDAISVVQAGGNAIGLGGTNGVKAFLEILKEKLPCVPLVLALDNDKYGIEAEQELMQGLANIGFSNYIKLNLYGACKDANEALTSTQDSFIREVKQVMTAQNLEDLKQLKQKEEYKAKSASGFLKDFIDIVHSEASSNYIPTGFKQLDEMLNGGLTQGLYTVGAISSLGKTTLLVQIADNIAKGQIDYTDSDNRTVPGKDVLFFSLEMSKMQLMAKSISRESYAYCLDKDIDFRDAKTSKDITTGNRYKSYNDTEKAIIEEAISRYKGYADHIYIFEGEARTTVNDIEEAIQLHIEMTGNTPIVIIDYLQLLAPLQNGMGDKQIVDDNIHRLYCISRKYKMPVICISSVNRASYKADVSMSMFKESGLIEYSSDVLIGLQYKGQGGEKFNLEKAKTANPRMIELIVMKNKEGETDKAITLKYKPNYNHFREA